MLYNLLVKKGGIYIPPKQDSTKNLRSILLGPNFMWNEMVFLISRSLNAKDSKIKIC